MAASGIHISLSAEPIANVGGLGITNSMFTSVLVSAILISFALIVNRHLKHTDKPTGIQNFAEWIVESLYNLVYSVTGNLKNTSLFFPVVSTFFLFILLNNWIGLLPGVGTIVVPAVAKHDEVVLEEHTLENPESVQVITSEHENKETPIKEQDELHATIPSESALPQAGTEIELTEPELQVEETSEHEVETVPLLRPGTADLNTTLALGIVSMFAVQVFGFSALQFGYFKKFINFSSPIMFFVGILEIISEFAKIISFAFRLFGNIFAGEVLLVVLTALTKVVGPIPFYGLEVFVGFIQALVFAMLSLVLFNMATIGHDEH